jgi:hypothetical protein
MNVLWFDVEQKPLDILCRGRQRLLGIEQIEERFGASGYKSFRTAGRLDQNVNVLNQIVGRVRCPSVCPLAFSRHTESSGSWGCEPSGEE